MQIGNSDNQTRQRIFKPYSGCSDPPTTTAPTTPPPATTVISKRLSDVSSLLSVSSQQRQKSPERSPPADAHFPHFLRYAEPPLAVITTVFSLTVTSVMPLPRYPTPSIYSLHFSRHSWTSSSFVSLPSDLTLTNVWS